MTEKAGHALHQAISKELNIKEPNSVCFTIIYEAFGDVTQALIQAHSIIRNADCHIVNTKNSLCQTDNPYFLTPELNKIVKNIHFENIFSKEQEHILLFPSENYTDYSKYDYFTPYYSEIIITKENQTTLPQTIFKTPFKDTKDYHSIHYLYANENEDFSYEGESQFTRKPITQHRKLEIKKRLKSILNRDEKETRILTRDYNTGLLNYYTANNKREHRQGQSEKELTLIIQKENIRPTLEDIIKIKEEDNDIRDLNWKSDFESQDTGFYSIILPQNIAQDIPKNFPFKFNVESGGDQGYIECETKKKYSNIAETLHDILYKKVPPGWGNGEFYQNGSITITRHDDHITIDFQNMAPQEYHYDDDEDEDNW